MTNGAKWPTRWRSANAETTAKHVPVHRPYAGEDDVWDQLPPAGSLTVQETAPATAWPMPLSAALPVPPPTAAPVMPPAMPPPMAPAPSPGLWLTGQWHPAAAQRSRMRAVIGDELRVPTLLCEFGGCVARYTHPDALGERELWDRALAAGWQYDLIGRLACPACVRHAPTFWARRPYAPANRDYWVTDAAD